MFGSMFNPSAYGNSPKMCLISRRVQRANNQPRLRFFVRKGAVCTDGSSISWCARIRQPSILSEALTPSKMMSDALCVRNQTKMEVPIFIRIDLG